MKENRKYMHRIMAVIPLHISLPPLKTTPSWTANSSRIVQYSRIMTGTSALESGHPARITDFSVYDASSWYECT